MEAGGLGEGAARRGLWGPRVSCSVSWLCRVAAPRVSAVPSGRGQHELSSPTKVVRWVVLDSTCKRLSTGHQCVKHLKQASSWGSVCGCGVDKHQAFLRSARELGRKL